MDSNREWAKKYLDRGLAICRLRPREKRPSYYDWTQFSLTPADFDSTDNIGILGGVLSGGLWTVDLDSHLALLLADDFLPDTGMEEGRPGKPRSHRIYRVTGIPDYLKAEPHVAGGIGGPRTKQFTAPDKKRQIDLIGTGGQTAAPPSLWTSKDGLAHERRRWDAFSEPRVIDCQELFECVSRLASACGVIKKEEVGPARRKTRAGGEQATRLPMPSGRAARLARAYVKKMAPAVAGRSGDAQTYLVACTLVLDFGLTPADALPLLLEFNERCSPPWSLTDLERKLAAADAQDRDDRGWKVYKSVNTVKVSVQPGDGPVFVGLDVDVKDRSYIDLSPSLYAGMTKTATGWALTPELESLAWEGREVILAPASTITTNTREVWSEFFLALLLRERGAEVKSLRLPPRDGRRRTLGDAGDVDLMLVEPPLNALQATEAAEQAVREKERVDTYRKSLPREKSSPALEKAARFILKHKITQLTKEVIKKGKRSGISRDTLRRALLSSSSLPLTPPLPLLCCISVYLHLKNHL